MGHGHFVSKWGRKRIFERISTHVIWCHDLPVWQEVAELLRHLLPDVQPELLDAELPLPLTQAAAVQSQHREPNHLKILIKDYKSLLKESRQSPSWHRPRHGPQDWAWGPCRPAPPWWAWRWTPRCTPGWCCHPQWLCWTENGHIVSNYIIHTYMGNLKNERSSINTFENFDGRTASFTLVFAVCVL